MAGVAAWAIAATIPVHAAPARDAGWSVMVQCYEVSVGEESLVWGYAVALGPAAATGVTCRLDGAVACAVEMPGPAASCTGSRASGGLSLPALVCGVGWATFTDGTTAETHTC